MGNLSATVEAYKLTTIIRNNNVRTAGELSISASSAKKWTRSKKFVLAKVMTQRIPGVCANVMAEADEYDGAFPIIDVNVNKVGRTVGGYAPKVVILAGADTVKKARRDGELYCQCWVGEKAMAALSIRADHEIGANELVDELRTKVDEKYNKQTRTGHPQPYRRIVEAYPMENYCIIEVGSKKFRQNYRLNPATREISLVGEPQAVFTQYKTQPTGVHAQGQLSLNSPESINNPAEGGMISRPRIVPDGVHYGAEHSELNIGMSLMTNVEEALDMYLHAIQNGQWKPVSSQYAPIPQSYVPLVKEAQIAAKAMHVSPFSVMDFLKWQFSVMKASRKTKNGLMASAFAYVGDRDDPSTWFLRCDGRETIKSSLSLLASTPGIPSYSKPAVKRKLLMLADTLA